MTPGLTVAEPGDAGRGARGGCNRAPFALAGMRPAEAGEAMRAATAAPSTLWTGAGGRGVPAVPANQDAVPSSARPEKRLG